MKKIDDSELEDVTGAGGDQDVMAPMASNSGTIPPVPAGPSGSAGEGSSSGGVGQGDDTVTQDPDNIGGNDGTSGLGSA